MKSLVRPTRWVGPALVIGPEWSDGWFARSRAIVIHDGRPRLCVVRELASPLRGDPELFRQHEALLRRRGRLLMTVTSRAFPSLLAALANESLEVVALVEAPPGDVTLDELVHATPMTDLPAGLALGVLEPLLRAWAELSRRQTDGLGLDAAELTFAWQGEVRAELDAATLSERTMAAGAMVTMPLRAARYLSPEQVRGLPPSPFSPMFTAGLVLHELLTGASAFPGEGFEFIRQLLTERPRPLRERRAGLPASVEAFAERCLQREPTARFPSWGALLAAFAKVQDHVGPAQATALAAVLERTFPNERAAAWALEDEMARLDLGHFGATLAASSLVPVDLPAFPLRSAATPTDEEDDEVLDREWPGRDARPMVRVGELLLDERPVTHDEYARFCLGTHRAPPSEWGGATPPPNLGALPIVVGLEDARAYARWAGKRLARLSEWHRAIATLGRAVFRVESEELVEECATERLPFRCAFDD